MTGGGYPSSDYGWQHQKKRAAWKPKVDAGRVNCARCGQLIVPDRTKKGDGWNLDHDPSDPTRQRYLGPSHSSCNHGGGPPPAPAAPDPDPTPSTSW